MLRGPALARLAEALGRASWRPQLLLRELVDRLNRESRCAISLHSLALPMALQVELPMAFCAAAAAAAQAR